MTVFASKKYNKKLILLNSTDYLTFEFLGEIIELTLNQGFPTKKNCNNRNRFSVLWFKSNYPEVKEICDKNETCVQELKQIHDNPNAYGIIRFIFKRLK